jgi:UDP-glucuronate 4-epimerase
MISVLVTGCAGFIGSHLVDSLLSKGYKVIGIDNFDPFYDERQKRDNLTQANANENFSFYEADIRERKQFDVIKEHIDAVIHLAAKAGVLPSIKNPDAYIETNITGTNHLLDFMTNREIRKYVFASSSSIYGNTQTIPFSEEDDGSFPISTYAVTKKACELLNHTYYHLHKIDAVNLRLFTVYGPRQRPDLAIHKFIRQINNNEDITMFGDGSTARDYTYVGDIVDGLTKGMDYVLANNGVYEIINIGNGKPVKLSDLIETIGNLTRKRIKVKKLPLQVGDVNITYANINKAKTLLNYNPQTSLETGIKNFADWYNYNLKEAI